MSEISEKTRLGMTIGGAAVVVALVFTLGQAYGSWRTDRVNEVTTLDRHEADIRELRTTFAEMQGTLRDIQNNQVNSRDSINTAVRNTTYLMESFSEVKVALAKSGIDVKGD